MATPDMATLHGVTPPASLPLLGRDPWGRQGIGDRLV